MTETSKKIAQVMEKEEEILARALAKSLGEVKKKATVQNLKDYEAAKEALEAFRNKKHMQENPEEALLNIPDAIDYLKGQGFKIEKSKLYEEKNIVGFTTTGNSVTFIKKDLDKYAKKFLTLLTDSDSNTAEEKMRWDAKIAEQKFKDMEIEAKIKEGKYILRSEVEQQLAARAAFLKDNLGSGFIHSRASKIAEILHGDPEKTPELIDFWLKQIEEVFDYYSKPMRFEAPVIILEEEEGENES